MEASTALRAASEELAVLIKTMMDHRSHSVRALIIGWPQLRVCLVHFAKMCKDVNRAFEVLNEVYL